MQSVLEQAGVRYTVYSGRSWPTYFGDAFTAFKDAPLIYAHYDLVPSFYDAVAAPMYGGWEGCVQLILQLIRPLTASDRLWSPPSSGTWASSSGTGRAPSTSCVARARWIGIGAPNLTGECL